MVKIAPQVAGETMTPFYAMPSVDANIQTRNDGDEAELSLSL